MKYATVIVLQIALAITILASQATAQDERLSLEWVFSEEGKTATSIPEHAWLDNGLLMLYDKRVPKAERTIESYNPDNGRRRTLVNAEKAIAGIPHRSNRKSLLKNSDGLRPLMQRVAGPYMRSRTTSCCWICGRVRSRQLR